MVDTVEDSAAGEADEDFPIANLFRELIYGAGATRDRSPDLAKALVRDCVTAYFPRFVSDPKYGMHLMRPLDYSCDAGAGVFVSTPLDLVRFGMAMQGGKLLQPAIVALLQVPRRVGASEETGPGLGWYRKTVMLAGKQTHVIGKDGDSLGGSVASLVAFPEFGLVIAVTLNIWYADTRR